MQKLGQEESISTQDFVDLLDVITPWEDIMTVLHLADRINYSSPLSLQPISQSQKLPAGNTTERKGFFAGFNFILNKNSITTAERISYITPMILQVIIQSAPLPIGKTIALTSLQEIQKRIHKLTMAIKQKLTQPTLMLADGNV